MQKYWSWMCFTLKKHKNEFQAAWSIIYFIRRIRFLSEFNVSEYFMSGRGWFADYLLCWRWIMQFNRHHCSVAACEGYSVGMIWMYFLLWETAKKWIYYEYNRRSTLELDHTSRRQTVPAADTVNDRCIVWCSPSLGMSWPQLYKYTGHTHHIHRPSETVCKNWDNPMLNNVFRSNNHNRYLYRRRSCET